MGNEERRNKVLQSDRARVDGEVRGRCEGGASALQLRSRPRREIIRGRMPYQLCDVNRACIDASQ
eukprot:1569545-Pleurochrysis_carterae.AAC.1